MIIRLLWLSLVLAGFLSPAADAEEFSSPIVGYYKFTVPKGQSLWVSGLVTKKEFQTRASSLSPGTSFSTIHFDTSLTGTFDLHYVEILEGPWAGLVLDIESHTDHSVTVRGNIGSSGFNLPSDVAFAIRKHATLGELFKEAGLSPFEDQIILADDQGVMQTFYLTFEGNIVHYYDPQTNRNNEIVYPAQGFILITTNERQLTFGKGEVNQVKDTPTKIAIYGNNRLNLVGLVNPVVAASPLGGGLLPAEHTPLAAPEFGLVSSGLDIFTDLIVPYADTSGILNGQAVFYYDGSTIVNSQALPASTEIPHGTAIILLPQFSKYYSQPPLNISL